MNRLQNLHTHSTYDDGKQTLDETVKIAIEKGFESIGFSGHSYMHYAPGASMSIEGTEEYKKEIKALKEKYKGKIDIYCGLEFDLYSEIDLLGYDYLVGSVHYLKINGKYVGFDRREASLVRLYRQTAIMQSFLTPISAMRRSFCVNVDLKKNIYL